MEPTPISDVSRACPQKPLEARETSDSPEVEFIVLMSEICADWEAVYAYKTNIGVRRFRLRLQEPRDYQPAEAEDQEDEYDGEHRDPLES